MLEEGHQQSNDMIAADDDFFILASFDDLSDVLPNIFGFLPPKDIMRSRRTNKKMMNAARITVVPPCDFCIDSLRNYNTMRVMTTEMPNLQQIKIGDIGQGHKYSDGEDPHERPALHQNPRVAVFMQPYLPSHQRQLILSADWTQHDIDIIYNFRKLRILIIRSAGLNGRYPVFFNFPRLQKLSIQRCDYLKWDLEMLFGLSLLRELDVDYNPHLTGNISSLRVLKDTLEKVVVESCPLVKGNFMDLADFPYLKELHLFFIPDVRGDIRDIGENDFSSLERLILPHGVYGGMGYKFQRISDAPDLVRAVYLLKKQRPELMDVWFGKLSEESPDWYYSADEADGDSPPFCVNLVQAGSRVGYRWKTDYHDPCEMNWLDPEPDSESSDYDEYIEELQSINSEVDFYNGFYQPPTEEEYRRLWEETTTLDD